MRNARVGLLMGLAILLVAIGVAVPVASRWLANRRLEVALREANGSVVYDCNPSAPGLRNWLASKLGQELVGSVDYVILEDVNDPAAVNGVLDILRDMSSLHRLALDHASFDESSVEAISQMQSLTTLWIISGDATLLSRLHGLPSLKTLSLSELTHFTPETFAALAKLPALNQLDLSRTDIRASQLGQLCLFPQLVVLHLDGTPLSVEDLTALAEAPSLQAVLVGTDFDNEVALQAFEKTMPKIKFLRTDEYEEPAAAR
jgi:hypothetical protein